MRTLPEGYSIEASSLSIVGFVLNGSHSYVRSTDCHCESRSQNIFSCIDVPVDAFCIAARTIPTAYAQWHFIHYKTAMVTSFATRKKAVDLDQFFTVPITLVLKLTKHFPPSSIANRTSHPPYVPPIRGDAEGRGVSYSKIFNSNQVVTIDQISSQLVQKIGTSIFDFGVYLSYFKSRFLSVTRAFGFPTQFLLRHLKLLIQPIEMFRITYFQPFSGGQQIRDSNINTNLFFSLRQCFYSRVIYQQRNKPSPRWFEFDCNSGWTNTVRQKPRPNNIQRFFTFSKPKSIVLVLKSRLGKLSRTAIAFSFKPGIFSSLAPEISKGFLQMSQTLLQRYTANFIEKIHVFSLFPTSKKTRGLFVINPLLTEVPTFGLGSKSFVVNEPDTSHCPLQEIFLLGSGKKSVSVSSFNHSLHFTMSNVKKLIRGAHS